MNIRGVRVNKVQDSRGEDTIEIEMTSDAGETKARIPSGRSRGEREAVAVGFAKAVESVEKLNTEFEGREFSTVTELDKALLEIDGTLNKENLGGNVMLGISLAFARALGREKGQELWEVIREEYFYDVDLVTPPQIYANMINGGAHAKTNLDIQEYIVIATVDENYLKTTHELKSFHKDLGEYLEKRYNLERVLLGDEKGYAVDFQDNLEPLKVLTELIETRGMTGYALGLDAAASGFESGGVYTLGGQEFTTEELCALYGRYKEESKRLVSIEDPFEENDREGFRLLREANPELQVVGDDLTVTNEKMIREYADELITGVIIKPNQIGTVTETCGALRAAGEIGVKRLVSHRSGEVDDQFLVHFAKASGAEAVKIGPPVGERLLKYDELSRLYD